MTPVPDFLRVDERFETMSLVAADGCPMFLRRARGSGRSGPAILLIHGASASSETFLEPSGSSVHDFLSARGFDLWFLDWRASCHVTRIAPRLSNQSCDYVAQHDLPQAVHFVLGQRAREGNDGPISLLAHCMGAACAAMAISAGSLQRRELDRIVLSTIGLFYVLPWDGAIKVQDRILERVQDEGPPDVVHPDVASGPWPPELERAYRMWPSSWLSPWKEDFFGRLSFLYGQTFLPSNLHVAMNRTAVRQLFGAVPFTLYRQAAQCALRGFAAALDAEATLPPSTRQSEMPRALSARYLNIERWSGLDVTLITGADNPLWHRDSIDRMGEWLSRVRVPQKYVLAGYGHQDLFWGRKSEQDVFPLLHRSLG